VTLKPKSGHRVVIRVENILDCSGATLIDLEILSTPETRTHPVDGIRPWGVGSKLYGCHISNINSSGVNWFSSGAGQIVDCVIKDHGYASSAHSIYTHNSAGGERVIDNNIMLPGFGRYLLHAFSSGLNKIQDYTVTRNIMSGKNVIIGGGLGVKNSLYHDNLLYDGIARFGVYKRTSGVNEDITITDNLFGPEATVDLADDFETVTESGNQTYNANHDDNLTYSVVSGARAIIHLCTVSERKLAHIAIINLGAADFAELDLAGTGLNADQYVLRSAHNWHETQVVDVVDGKIQIPAKGWTVSKPHAYSFALYSPLPFFGAFILETV
jgi:hypothetical protein